MISIQYTHEYRMKLCSCLLIPKGEMETNLQATLLLHLLQLQVTQERMRSLFPHKPLPVLNGSGILRRPHPLVKTAPFIGHWTKWQNLTTAAFSHLGGSGSREKGMQFCQVSPFPCLLQACSPVCEMLPSTLREGLSSSVNPLWKLPHRHTQRSASLLP